VEAIKARAEPLVVLDHLQTKTGIVIGLDKLQLLHHKFNIAVGVAPEHGLRCDILDLGFFNVSFARVACEESHGGEMFLNCFQFMYLKPFWFIFRIFFGFFFGFFSDFFRIFFGFFSDFFSDFFRIFFRIWPRRLSAKEEMLKR